MIRTLLVVAALFASLTGCTQMPTEKQNVVDMRPQISFKTDGEQMHSGRVFVDGLEIGSVGDYLEGRAAFKVLPGVHQIKVQLNGAPVHDEKIYVGDGVNRSVLIK